MTDYPKNPDPVKSANEHLLPATRDQFSSEEAYRQHVLTRQHQEEQNKKNSGR